MMSTAEISFELVHDASYPKIRSIQNESSVDKSLIALDIQAKYQFLTEQGELFHEYGFFTDRHIQNCGGYVDKLLKYRSPEVINFILRNQPSLELFRGSPFPVLHGRSAHIDLILVDLIDSYRRQYGVDRVSLLDHGCSVAEHFDLLDLIFRVKQNRKAQDFLSYYGLDVSPLVLSAAKLLHNALLGNHFRLILGEGSKIPLPDKSIDFSISVGVVNHVERPLEALDSLVKVTRGALVMAIWVTQEPKGFWAVNHSGVSNYFFAGADLARFTEKHSKEKFFSAEFVAEHDSSQPSSYVGLSEERVSRIGSYILVLTGLEDLPAGLSPVDFSR
jgi:hypothetical protein